MKDLIELLKNSSEMPRAPKIKQLGPNGRRVDRELRRMYGLLRDPPTQPQLITAEEVESVRLAELQRRKAAGTADERVDEELRAMFHLPPAKEIS